MKLKKYLFINLLVLSHILHANIVIENASILDGENQKQYFANILIKGMKIENISDRKFQAEKIIDATGLIVTPGFIAPDTKIGIIEIGALSVTKDDSDNFYDIGVSIHDAFNPQSTLIPWNRSNGITSSISIPSRGDLPIGGLASFYILDGSFEITSAKDIAMTGRIGGSNNSSRSKEIALINDLLLLAQDTKNIDMNSLEDINAFIKKTPLADRLDLLSRDIIALNKLITKEIALIVNVHRASDILKLIELKKIFDLRVVISGGQESWMVADAIAEANIPVILDPLNNIPNSFDQLGARSDTAKLLDEKGVLVMFKVDRSHNYHLIRQGAGNAVANGLDYYSAISGLTSNVADVFKIKDRGKIKKGFYADLILWDGDPLEPTSMPSYLLINGKLIDLTSRSTRLRDRYTNKNNLPNTYKN